MVLKYIVDHAAGSAQKIGVNEETAEGGASAPPSARTVRLTARGRRGHIHYGLRSF